MLNQPNCTLYFHPFLRNSLNYAQPLFIPHQPCPFHGRSQQVFTCTITTNHFNLNHTKVIGNWGRKVSLFKDNYFLFFLFLDVAINAPFLSAWHDLIVNGRSPVTIPHPLNEIPGKVDVQVKVTHGGQDYFFPGIGSGQSDDDILAQYGGVAYLYNHLHVLVFIPKEKLSGQGIGRVITTGNYFQIFKNSDIDSSSPLTHQQ